MNIYICSTQPDVFRFLAYRIEKKGHNCILFSTYTSYLNTLYNSKCPPDLAILDYTLENHLISKSPYESLYEQKIFMPVIYYNDPCIGEGARLNVWEAFINYDETKKFIADEQRYIPPFEEIQKILVLVNDFIESAEFKPYIKLMQPPKPFPKQLCTDYISENLLSAGSFSDSIFNLQDELKLPDNLYVLLKILYEHKNKILSAAQIQKYYSEEKAEISEASLSVLISKLRSSIKKSSVCNYRISKVPDGYKLETE